MITSRTVDWEFIQKTSGLRVMNPILESGRVLLPIEYDPSGTTNITQPSTLINSGLMVRKIKAEWKGSLLMLEVVTSVIENGAQPKHSHYIDITSSPRMKFSVAYGIMRNKAVSLGEFDNPRLVSPAPSSAP